MGCHNRGSVCLWRLLQRCSGLIVVLLVFGVLLMLGACRLGTENTPLLIGESSASSSAVRLRSQTIIAVAKPVKALVVNLLSIGKGGQGWSVFESSFFDDPFFWRFFDKEFELQFHQSREFRQEGMELGLIINADRYIATTTNYVVAKMDEIEDSLPDNHRKSLEMTVGKLQKETSAPLALVDVKGEHALASVHVGPLSLDQNEGQERWIKGGVVVHHIDPSSPAARAGLRDGDVIREINRQAVTSVEEFERLVGTFKVKERVAVIFTRDREMIYLVIGPR